MPSRFRSSGDTWSATATSQRLTKIEATEGTRGRTQPRSGLHPAHVRLGGAKVLLGREKQRHVDGGTREDRLLDRLASRVGAGEQVAELHVELVLGSLQASRELIAEAIESVSRRAVAASRSRGGGVPIKPPALPERATIAVVAPASPPQTRSGIEQATAYFEGRGHRVVFGPNHRKVHGYLAGTDAERAADLQWALSEPGIDMVHDALRRLRHRAAARSDRLGRARRAANRLRVQRHHRPAPGARRPRGLGLVLRAELPALHAAEGPLRADRGDGGLVPPRLQARAARPGVRGPRGPVRAHGGRGPGRGAAGRRLPDAADARASGRRTRSRPTAAS